MLSNKIKQTILLKYATNWRKGLEAYRVVIGRKLNILAEAKVVSGHIKYMIFVGLAAMLIVMGLVLSPSIPALIEGYKALLLHPALLDFDGLQQPGHFGAAFFNAGLLLLIVLAVYRFTKTDLQGIQIAAAMVVVGFSFYGKNILNIWFTIIGVLLCTALSKKSLSGGTALAWFSTALAPVFSVLAFGTPILGPGSPLAYGVAALVGILAGVVVWVLAGSLPRHHEGFTLYNAGLAAGLAGMFINSLLVAFGLGHDRYPYAATEYISGQNGFLALFLLITFVYLALMGILLGGMERFQELAWYRAKGGNYVEQFGFGASLINMSLMGLIATAYVFVTGTGQLAGPVFGCIYTAVGFAADGVSMRMYLPSMAGVFGMSFLAGGIMGLLHGESFFSTAIMEAGSRDMLMAAIFSCGLAPVVGRFGPWAGVFAGAVHSILLPHIGALHGWMSLYNNGFSLGLIAIFLYPVYAFLGDKASKVEGAIEPRVTGMQPEIGG